jgi:hypothetical protein
MNKSFHQTGSFLNNTWARSVSEGRSGPHSACGTCASLAEAGMSHIRSGTTTESPIHLTHWTHHHSSPFIEASLSSHLPLCAKCPGNRMHVPACQRRSNVKAMCNQGRSEPLTDLQRDALYQLTRCPTHFPVFLALHSGGLWTDLWHYGKPARLM